MKVNFCSLIRQKRQYFNVRIFKEKSLRRLLYVKNV